MIPGTDERRLRSRTSAHAIFNISGQCWHCSVFEKYQDMYVYIYIYCIYFTNSKFCLLVATTPTNHHSVTSQRSHHISYKPIRPPKKTNHLIMNVMTGPWKQLQVQRLVNILKQNGLQASSTGPSTGPPLFGFVSRLGTPQNAKFDGEINSWTNPRV